MRYETKNITNAYDDCRNEQQFKMRWISFNRPFWKKLWCIETEETVAGFPDVLGIDFEGKAHFFEFKISDSKGNIKFQPTQPAFYRMNSDINVSVIALSRKKGFLQFWVHFKPKYLFDGNMLNGKATVNLDSMVNYISYHNLWNDNNFEFSSYLTENNGGTK